MANIRIADRTIAVLQKSLDMRAQKQQVIAGNIANAETPGYAVRKLNFEDNLRSAINTPVLKGQQNNPKYCMFGSGGIGEVQANITKQPSQNPLGDGNSVSMDYAIFYDDFEFLVVFPSL